MGKIITLCLLAATVIFGCYLYYDRRASGYDSTAWARLNDNGSYTDTSLTGITMLGKKVIFKDVPLMEIDKGSGKKIPLKLGRSSAVYSACTDADGHVYALCKLQDKVIIEKQNGNSWTVLPVPDMVIGQLQEFQLVSDKNQIALVAPGAVFLWINGGWIKVYASPRARDPITLAPNSQSIMDNGTVFVSRADDKHGSVSAINLKTGKSVEIFNGPAVPDMTLSKERLWFISSEKEKSALFSVSTDAAESKPRLEASTSSFRYNILDRIGSGVGGAKLKPDNSFNWPFGATVFSGLSAGAEGSILVATRDIGLLKYSGGKWQKLTPYWPDSNALNPVLTDIVGVQSTGDANAVIAVRRGGLVYYDSKKKRYSFWLDPKLPK